MAEQQCDWCEGDGCDECKGKVKEKKIGKRKPAHDDAGDWGDGDGDGWGDDSFEDPVASALAEPPSLARKRSFTIISAQSIFERIQKLITEAAEELFVDENQACALLLKYQWNVDKLRSEWLKDSKAVRKKCGVRTPVDSKGKKPKRVQCNMYACDEVEVEEATALNCGHWFCNTCWEQILSMAIKHGRNCIYFVCPAMNCKKLYCQHSSKKGCKCDEMVPTSIFRKFVKDAELIKNYDRWLVESFVEGNDKIKWCPRPGCNLAVEYPSMIGREMQCSCGEKFCFSCGKASHVPAPCDLVELYNKFGSADDATEILLAATTKECPNCKVRITKNKACNHMTCAKCRHEFCWLCKGDWKQHGSQTGGFYVCKKYNEDSAKGVHTAEELEMKKKQEFLQSPEYVKYLHYRTRFDHHRQGAMFAQEFIKKVHAAPEYSEKFKSLLEAARVIVDCRRVLQWTFCILYYLRPSGKRDLFEKWQEMLNGFTEQLQEILEKKSNLMELLEPKTLQDIVNRSRTIDGFRIKTVEECEKPEFTELLAYKMEREPDSWYCTACQKTHQGKDKLKLKHCPNPSCGACRQHGEPECRVPGCAKS